ncbi:hypothetical protein Tco_0843241 [Tanacetum coccineum]|uniref:Uncharacterized protein n=1 Tax=Tanacetum coccineum TaxID=301880 RepID=A0ABQ5B3A6_9ASTR
MLSLYIRWKEERVRLLVGSPGASTTPIYSPGSSSTPIYSPGASRNAECSNCKHLLDKITVLEAMLEMYKNPEQHTLNSAALLHDVYNDLGKLDSGVELAVRVEVDRMRGAEATGEHTTADIKRMVRGGIVSDGPTYSWRGTREWRGPRAVITLIDEDGDDTGGEDGGDDTRLSLGKILPPWHNSLTKNKWGPLFAGDVAAGSFAIDALPHQLFPSENFFPSEFRWGYVSPADMSLAIR